ncbi:MAG TPA: MFS transporter [Gaiellaceae bacterium]|nr:MFS transporter [Gaiellaceae bacterium]
MRTTDRRAAVAALALGAGVTWNISNVGAVADPLADAYGISLAAVGLLTTALFLTHLGSQIPGGRASDRWGARRVGLVALAACVAGNALALVAPNPWLAGAGRLVTGVGSGAGFVAGADYIRASGGSAFLQGLYGAFTMGGGGLAIAVTPQLVGPLGWRAPYWSALAAALVTAAVLAVAPRDRRHGPARPGLVADRRLARLGILHGATFGLSVVAANWVVPLLERHGEPRGLAAVLGALLLLAGIVTRPVGGMLLRGHAERGRIEVVVSLVALGTGFLLLALPLPSALLGCAALLAGLAAGLPFAFVFTGAQRLRPDAPGAAIGFVNSFAIVVVVAGTPLLGLTFSLPGEGRLGFAAAAACCAAALLVVPRLHDRAATE